MNYTVPYVMVLMRADPIRGQLVTATFQKCGSFTSWMYVENWWPPVKGMAAHVTNHVPSEQ
jgi:hypothetical protein